jgi:hypothetical protein
MCPGGLCSFPARAWLATDAPAHLVLLWYDQDVLTAFRGQWWESRNRHTWDLGPCGDWMEPRWWSLEACCHCRDHDHNHDQPWRQLLRENRKEKRIVQSTEIRRNYLFLYYVSSIGRQQICSAQSRFPFEKIWGTKSMHFEIQALPTLLMRMLHSMVG